MWGRVANAVKESGTSQCPGPSQSLLPPLQSKERDMRRADATYSGCAVRPVANMGPSGSCPCSLSMSDRPAQLLADAPTLSSMGL